MVKVIAVGKCVKGNIIFIKRLDDEKIMEK